jgi:hypothetical protein
MIVISKINLCQKTTIYKEVKLLEKIVLVILYLYLIEKNLKSLNLIKALCLDLYKNLHQLCFNRIKDQF